MSRITRLKGLHVALEALKGVTAPVVFTVYGTSEDAPYLAQCRAIAATLPTNVAVDFAGELMPEAVRPTLAGFDVLVLPTTGENFGHVFPEALSVSCAVATTAATPWSQALSVKGGIVLEHRGIDAWRNALQRLAELPNDEILAMRCAAGEVYDVWANRPKEPHVWSTALGMRQSV